MFEGDRITGIIDWELSHAGDAMEDLAWVALRGALDTVPDLSGILIRHCEMHDIEADERRMVFNQALVLWKVLVIRQRAVGDYTRNLGRNVYYRLVHRRMFVEVMSRALGRPEPQPPDVAAGETPRSWLYDACVHHVKATALPVLDPERAATMAGLVPSCAIYAHGTRLEQTPPTKLRTSWPVSARGDRTWRRPSTALLDR